MSAQRCIPAFTCSSLLKYYFFKLGMRENTREVRVFTVHKALPSSHTAASLPASPLCVSCFHQIPRQCLCDFLILVPLLSLSLLSVSETKVSVTLPGFMCVSLPPYLSSLCSAALDSWDVCLSQRCHRVPLQWVGPPLHLSPRCERHHCCYHRH